MKKYVIALIALLMLFAFARAEVYGSEGDSYYHAAEHCMEYADYVDITTYYHNTEYSFIGSDWGYEGKLIDGNGNTLLENVKGELIGNLLFWSRVGSNDLHVTDVETMNELALIPDGFAVYDHTDDFFVTKASVSEYRICSMETFETLNVFDGEVTVSYMRETGIPERFVLKTSEYLNKYYLIDIDGNIYGSGYYNITPLIWYNGKGLYFTNTLTDEDKGYYALIDESGTAVAKDIERYVGSRDYAHYELIDEKSVRVTFSNGDSTVISLDN